jgi:hypothetical protein
MMPTLDDDCWSEIKGFLLFEKDERRATLHGAAMKAMINTITTRTIFEEYEREEIITFTNEGAVAGAAVPAFTITGYNMMMGGHATDYAEVYEDDYMGRGITLLFNGRPTSEHRGHVFYSEYIMHTARTQVKNLELYAALRALAIERYGEEQVEHVEENYYAVAIDAEAHTLIDAFAAIEEKCKENPLEAHIKECRLRWIEEGLITEPAEVGAAPSVGVAIAAGAVAGAVAGAAWSYIAPVD